jgi:hypothetical protein
MWLDFAYGGFGGEAVVGVGAVSKPRMKWLEWLGVFGPLIGLVALAALLYVAFG